MNWDDTYMKITKLYANHSKCSAKKVACTIVKDNNILAVGLNGTQPGTTNCNELFYKSPVTNIWYKKDDSTGILEQCGKEEHHEWSLIHETHAEINALAKANNNSISVSGSTAYITHSPCTNCAKTLATFGITKIVYEQEYDDIDEVKNFLNIKGIEIIKWKGSGIND